MGSKTLKKTTILLPFCMYYFDDSMDCQYIYIYIYIYILWIYALIHIMPEGVISDVLLGSLESFGSSNIILPSPCRPYQIWSVSDTPYHSRNVGKKKKMEIELAFYLFGQLLTTHPCIWLVVANNQSSTQICLFKWSSRTLALFNIWIVQNYSFT